jgi:hypothetical protein
MPPSAVAVVARVVDGLADAGHVVPVEAEVLKTGLSAQLKIDKS